MGTDQLTTPIPVTPCISGTWRGYQLDARQGKVTLCQTTLLIFELTEICLNTRLATFGVTTWWILQGDFVLQPTTRSAEITGNGSPWSQWQESNVLFAEEYGLGMFATKSPSLPAGLESSVTVRYKR